MIESELWQMLPCLPRTLSQALREQLQNQNSRRLRVPYGAASLKSDVGVLGRSEAFISVMKQVGRVAGTNLPVLLTGESGTGKEVIALSLHSHCHNLVLSNGRKQLSQLIASHRRKIGGGTSSFCLTYY
jgi:transcriptional regulator with GAF, ATPase, and Fis domain